MYSTRKRRKNSKKDGGLCPMDCFRALSWLMSEHRSPEHEASVIYVLYLLCHFEKL